MARLSAGTGDGSVPGRKRVGQPCREQDPHSTGQPRPWGSGENLSLTEWYLLSEPLGVVSGICVNASSDSELITLVTMAKAAKMEHVLTY